MHQTITLKDILVVTVCPKLSCHKLPRLGANIFHIAGLLWSNTINIITGLIYYPVLERCVFDDDISAVYGYTILGRTLDITAIPGIVQGILGVLTGGSNL